MRWGFVGYLVLGVDPGATTAVCIFDLSGNLVLAESRKNGHKWVFSRVLEFGKPIIVASDVADPPDAVRKIAASFGAKLVCPKEDLTVEYKEELALKYGLKKDKHVRDALAAAYYALSVYLPRFKKVEKKLKERGIPCTEEIKKKIVFGESPYVVGRKEEKKRIRKKERDLRYELKIKNEEIKRLREKLRALSGKIMKIGDPLSEIEKMKLRAELENIKNILKGVAQGKYIVKETAEDGDEVVYEGEGFVAVVKKEKSIREIISNYVKERKRSLLKRGSF